MNEKDRQLVIEVIRMTIAELQRAGMLVDGKDSAYSDINDRLKRFYDKGEKDAGIAEAIKALDGDPYAKIIPMYYGYGYTIDEIADAFSVETSTISRNKKRLALAIFKRLQ